jgi:hypothetical protein
MSAPDLAKINQTIADGPADEMVMRASHGAVTTLGRVTGTQKGTALAYSYGRIIGLGGSGITIITAYQEKGGKRSLISECDIHWGG